MAEWLVGWLVAGCMDGWIGTGGERNRKRRRTTQRQEDTGAPSHDWTLPP